jgi:hypothetical protein
MPKYDISKNFESSRQTELVKKIVKNYEKNEICLKMQKYDDI